MPALLVEALEPLPQLSRGVHGESVGGASRAPSSRVTPLGGGRARRRRHRGGAAGVCGRGGGRVHRGGVAGVCGGGGARRRDSRGGPRRARAARLPKILVEVVLTPLRR